MNKKLLNKAIVGLLGTAALSMASSQAYAIGGESVDLGAFTGTTISSGGHYAPYKAWTDYGNRNFGWTHTGSSWAKLQIGSAEDIAAGTRYDVSLKMTATGSSALDNPAFSVWTSGVSDFNLAATEFGVHAYSQVRGPHDGGVSDNANFAAIGITDWIGYANAGFVVTNADGDTLSHGGVTNNTALVSNPSASTWDYSQTTGLDFALLNIAGLKSGYYLIAAGGSCGSPNPATLCTKGQDFKWDVSGSVVSAVPVPGAVWLFGSAMAGLVGVSKRKRAA